MIFCSILNKSNPVLWLTRPSFASQGPALPGPYLPPNFNLILHFIPASLTFVIRTVQSLSPSSGTSFRTVQSLSPPSGTSFPCLPGDNPTHSSGVYSIVTFSKKWAPNLSWRSPFFSIKQDYWNDIFTLEFISVVNRRDSLVWTFLYFQKENKSVIF